MSVNTFVVRSNTLRNNVNKPNFTKGIKYSDSDYTKSKLQLNDHPSARLIIFYFFITVWCLYLCALMFLSYVNKGPF